MTDDVDDDDVDVNVNVDVDGAGGPRFDIVLVVVPAGCGYR